MNRSLTAIVAACWLVAGCHRPPPEDPAEKVYRNAVQLFAQASAASQDLTYRDPRFDAVLAALAKVPESSEFRPDADALANRIRTAREAAAAADLESAKAIDQALAQPAFESQGKSVATQGSTVPPTRVVQPSAAQAPSGAGVAPPVGMPTPQAVRRSLAAGDQEPPEDQAAPDNPDSQPAADSTATSPPPATGSRAAPTPPPTPPGQIFGLPGPAGRAMGTRP